MTWCQPCRQCCQDDKMTRKHQPGRSHGFAYLHTRSNLCSNSSLRALTLSTPAHPGAHFEHKFEAPDQHGRTAQIAAYRHQVTRSIHTYVAGQGVFEYVQGTYLPEGPCEPISSGTAMTGVQPHQGWFHPQGRTTDMRGPVIHIPPNKEAS